MHVRFFIDPETDRPHVEDHGVTAEEAIEVLESRGETFSGQGDSTITIGRTLAGRYIKVAHKRDEFGESPEDIWVITAYPLNARELKAHRRRMKKKP